jgi:hypothetical protein
VNYLDNKDFDIINARCNNEDGIICFTCSSIGSLVGVRVHGATNIQNFDVPSRRSLADIKICFVVTY